MPHPARGQSIKEMVTQDLGYCCLPFFFSRYKKNALIAARLGVSDRAVRYNRAEVLASRVTCENCSGCLEKRLASKPAISP